jgi:hypothetical protein
MSRRRARDEAQGATEVVLPKPPEIAAFADFVRARCGTVDPEMLQSFAAGTITPQLGQELVALLTVVFEAAGFDESGHVSRYGGKLEDLIALVLSQSEREV